MRRLLDIARLRLRSLFHGRQLDAELDRELRSHLENQIEENVARGMSREEARFAALRTFGGLAQVGEEARDARGVSMVENVLRDLRYTLRGLARQPMLLVAATVSIALGVGGNLAVFTVARELLFAAPDARRPEELVQIEVSHGSHIDYQRWLDLEASGALEQIAGYSIDRQLNWHNGDAAVSITPLFVTANFFDVTGIPLSNGRAFTAPEARAESEPRVVVVSHAFWQREMRGEPDIIGQSLVLNGQSFTILGVLAPKLRSIVGFGISPAVYVPLSRTLVPEISTPRTALVQPLGRLKPGQTLAEGRAAVDAADRRLGRLAGDTVYAGVQQFSRAGGIASGRGMRIVGAFMALLALVSLLVLLIACANVAGLLIARATTRRQEVAVRLALGGTRSRLVQQFLVEGFWLALFGTIAGMGLVLVFMRVMNQVTLPVALPIEINFAPDRTVLLCGLALAALSTVLCALLPALGATRLTLTPALKREATRYTGRRFTPRDALLVGQVTVSTLLLVTAFLFVRNLARTHVTNPGFEVERALVTQIGFVAGTPRTERITLLERAAERLAAVGAEHVAYTTAVPLTMHSGSSNGRQARFGDGEPMHVEFQHSFVGPDYFATSGIRLLRGREFTTSDGPGAPPVVIVNEEFARRYLGAATPVVGGRLRFVEGKLELDIVGVVANSKYFTIGEELRPALYEAFLQQAEIPDLAFVLARTRLDPGTMVTAVRGAIGALDRSISVEVQPMRSVLAFALLPSRIGALVLGTLGALALVLAMFGLYAIVSYTVSRRVGEIAIRVALGATRERIVWLVMRDASVLVLLGVTLGLGTAAMVTQPLARFLVTGLSTTDPLSFAATAGAFVIISMAASWLPARYAIRVSPAIAMRLE